MRAPVQKKRPRRTGKQQTASKAAPQQGGRTDDHQQQPAVGTGRPAHVRTRLIGAVAVVAAAIAAAGAPSVMAASGQLRDAQELVTLAEQTQQALTLAHALADERDEVTSYIAAGRPKSEAPSEERSARVDRQVDELKAEASPALRDDLAAIAGVRRSALTGKSTALEAHEAYSAAIAELHALAEDLAEQLPPRAGAGAHALAELDTAVQQAAAARGLLLAALHVPTSTQTVYDPVTGLPTTANTSSDADAEQRDALSAAAQQARVRSDAALAGFRETAPERARTAYDSTVTGPEAGAADEHLAKLTDQPTLSDTELNTGTDKLDAALTARVELMRGVEASLYDRRTKDLAQLRDDDVTALEIRIAVLGGLLLVAVGIATAMARTLTRPLAVLRIGSARVAADPVTEEPVKFTGRNDEFAQVVRSVNALHAHAVALHERLAPLEGDRKHLIGQRRTMAEERDRLRTELAEATAQLDQVRSSVNGTFVNLSLRILGLVERQLAVIEQMEEREQDPDRLDTLFKLDHFATVMRRHSENLLVLAGAEHGQQHAGPVPLVDVVRAAVSEIERYDRVRIAALPPHAHIAGFAADDLSHLIAELLENATSFSPPDLQVEVSGWLLENGEVMLSVQDEGIGITAERLERFNARLKSFDPDEPYDQESGDGLGLGLYVVSRLAHRHGVRVRLREQKQGGIAAVAVLPKPLLAAASATAVPASGSVAAQGPAMSLPGADAEANSNVLPLRSTVVVREPDGDGDPLIEAAERALREREAAGDSDAVEDAVRDEDAPRSAAPAEAEETSGADEAPERVSETTMELLAPAPPADTTPSAETTGAPEAPGTGPAATPAASPFTIGPDAHERAADGGEADEEEAAHSGEAPRFTDKGLPKRTPRISAPAPAPRPRAGGVNAEELRRRLGGFHQGAKDGRRDVAAEIAEQTGETKVPAARRHDERRPLDQHDQHHPGEASGGTSEEASS
ncbi:nitrate- and nitrite sensing domain-containing protein [Streptomyces poonensis]|uniref:Signal transduction histidine-protein kinase/phosphatase MprB n=1 Tax=Streptomyces poonensis TaxID=68255 RepID=A0A918P8S8_9ACTN|nr:nitrate- and nitrite sensing domain-containing protein [Streptomyces poonensis]GGY88862.1 histidine kinase [Streptomyces poonensis]GLJ92426.1 histidine kinase [Streptomyces poonensis]